MRKTILFLALVFFPVVGFCLDFKIDNYRFITDDTLGTFGIDAGTYTFTSGALVGLEYSFTVYDGVNAVSFSESLEAGPFLFLPSSTAIKNRILTDLNNKGYKTIVLNALSEKAQGVKENRSPGVVPGVKNAVLVIN